MLIYVHGKDSGPFGKRAALLKRHFAQIRIPQLTNELDWRVPLLNDMIESNAVLVGSSLGGLTSLIFARDYPEKIAAMVLLAPAVGFYDPEYDTPEINERINELVIPANIPTTVLAAKNDDIIRLEAVERLVDRSPGDVQLQVFDDDHLLLSELAQVAQIKAIRAMCERADKPDLQGRVPCS